MQIIKIIHRQLLPSGLAALLLLCAFHSLFAQSNVRLLGSVYDADSGAPLAGANIYLETTVFGAVSDDDGNFYIENIPPETYTVVFSLLGYAEEKRSGVTISEDVPRRLTVGLNPAAIIADTVNVFSRVTENGAGVEGDKIVLTAEDIERYRSLGLPQLLQQVAGVQVESTGGGASRSTIRIHGSGSGQVLVLLDGQRLNEPQTGEVDLNEVPLEQIERIEIVRQGNTAVFGGNAFAGVVSFSTRKVQQHTYGMLHSQAGSFSSVMGSVAAGFSLGQVGIIANYQQDYSRQNFTYGYQGESLERENAWYRNRKIFAKLNRRFARHDVNVLYNYREGEQGLPSAFYEEMRHFNAYKDGAAHAFQISDRWLAGAKGFVDANFAYHRLEQLYNNEDDPSPFTRYKIRQENEVLEPKLTAYFNPASFLETRFGLQYLEETLNQENLLYPSLTIGQKQRHTRAAYGSAELAVPPRSPILKSARLRSALRYESYFEQPGAWYPLLGITIVPAALPALSISSSWAKAIRYPDFNSLFWKGDARAQGNPNLLPERKTLWNISARIQARQWYWPVFSLYYYAEDLHDLIFWHRGVNGVWEPRNTERAEKRGWDAQLEQALLPERLHLQAAYSYINALNKSEEPNLKDRRIVFTPQHTANISLWLQSGKLYWLLVYRYVSERETVPANTGQPLPEYQLWDVTASWRQPLGRLFLSLGIAIKNIDNSNYELLRGYPMPGREFQFTLELTYKTQ